MMQRFRKQAIEKTQQPLRLRATQYAGILGVTGAIAFSCFPLTNRAAVGLDNIPDAANQSREVEAELADRQTQVTQLPDILFDIIPPEIIPDSEFIAQISELVRTVGDRQGQYAVLTAGVLASNNPNISRWLTALEASPFRNVDINGLELGDFAEQLANTVDQRNAAVEAIARQADQEALAYSAVNYANLPDLRQTGPLGVQVQTLSVSNTENDTASDDTASDDTASDASDNTDSNSGNDAEATAENAVTVTAYFPESLFLGGLTGLAPDPAPVILISHGVGGRGSHFAELAEHLASYGFVVVVPDHESLTTNAEDAPTSSLDSLRDQFFGAMNPVELVKRPLTLSAILDEMERLNTSNPMIQGRLDLDNVGVIGHSLGGYTGLAMVTGDINRRQLKRTCNDDEILALNLSLLLQCQARALPRRLPSLYDDRIKAVIALNPVGSTILGESQIEDIDVPVMMVSGSHDAIAPMLSEQLPAFSWLENTDKYLVTLVPGGHASMNMIGELQANAEPSTNADLIDQITRGRLDPQAGQATTALSVAFMTTYLSWSLAEDTPTEPYLNAAYGNFLSEGGFDLHMVTEWEAE